MCKLVKTDNMVNDQGYRLCIKSLHLLLISTAHMLPTKTFEKAVDIATEITKRSQCIDALQYCLEKPRDTEVSDTSDFADSAGRVTRNYEIYYCGVAPCEALKDFWNSIYSSDNALLKADQKDFFITGDNNIRDHCSRQRGSFGHVTKDSWKTSDF